MAYSISVVPFLSLAACVKHNALIPVTSERDFRIWAQFIRRSGFFRARSLLLSGGPFTCATAQLMANGLALGYTTSDHRWFTGLPACVSLL